MISLKQQIAYDMAGALAHDSKHHDPLPADVQRTLDADIQKTLAKLQTFMAEDTIKAFAIVAVGQESTLTTLNAVGAAAARLAMVMVDKGTEVAAEMMEDYVEQVLVLELDDEPTGFILIIDTPSAMITHLDSNQSNRLQLGEEATLVADFLRCDMENRGQGYKDADD